MIKKALLYGEIFLFCGLIIMLGYYYYYSTSLFPFYQKKLIHIVEQRTDEISHHLNEQEKNAIALSHNKLVLEALLKPSVDDHIQQELTTFFKSEKELMHFKS